MNCKDFSDNLKAFTANRLDEKKQHECELHLTSCSDCLDNWRSITAPAFAQDKLSEEKLRKAIMVECELQACAECEQLLSDSCDKTLIKSYSELVSSHLKNCSSCRNTSIALDYLTHELPILAYEQPPAGLLNTILEKTLPWHKLLLQKYSFDLWDFSKLLRRPRFSMEASFLVTAIYLALLGLPESFLPATQVEQVFTQSISNTQQHLQTGIARVTNSANALGNSGAQLVKSGVDKVRQSGNELKQRFDEELEQIRSRNITNNTDDPE